MECVPNFRLISIVESNSLNQDQPDIRLCHELLRQERNDDCDLSFKLQTENDALAMFRCSNLLYNTTLPPCCCLETILSFNSIVYYYCNFQILPLAMC